MGSKQSGPLVVQSADVERVEMPHGVFRLLADAGSTGGALGANRLTLGTGADGARPHYHAVSWEVFSVLDGTAEFLLGDRMSVVGAGGLVAVPRACPTPSGPPRTVRRTCSSSPRRVWSASSTSVGCPGSPGVGSGSTTCCPTRPPTTCTSSGAASGNRHGTGADPQVAAP